MREKINQQLAKDPNPPFIQRPAPTLPQGDPTNVNNYTVEYLAKNNHPQAKFPTVVMNGTGPSSHYYQQTSIVGIVEK